MLLSICVWLTRHRGAVTRMRTVYAYACSYGTPWGALLRCSNSDLKHNINALIISSSYELFSCNKHRKCFGVFIPRDDYFCCLNHSAWRFSSLTYAYNFWFVRTYGLLLIFYKNSAARVMYCNLACDRICKYLIWNRLIMNCYCTVLYWTRSIANCSRKTQNKVW